MKTVKFTTLFIALIISVVSAKENTETTVLSLLKESGAVTYAVKENYGSGLENLYIGYDQEGKEIIGLATRLTKTYKKVTTIIAVVPSDGKYKVSKAVLPEGTKLPGGAEKLALEALDNITGALFIDQASTKELVDANSGATKYAKQIYISYSLMAKAVIKELEAKPNWTKKPLPQK